MRCLLSFLPGPAAQLPAIEGGPPGCSRPLPLPTPCRQPLRRHYSTAAAAAAAAEPAAEGPLWAEVGGQAVRAGSVVEFVRSSSGGGEASEPSLGLVLRVDGRQGLLVEDARWVASGLGLGLGGGSWGLSLWAAPLLLPSACLVPLAAGQAVVIEL